MSSYLLKKIYNRFDYFVSEEDIYQLLLNHELSDTRMGIRFIFPLYTILIMYFTYLRIMAIGMTNILGIIEAIGMILLLAQQMIADPSIMSHSKRVYTIGYASISYVLLSMIIITSLYHLPHQNGNLIFICLFLSMPLFLMDQILRMWLFQSLMGMTWCVFAPGFDMTLKFFLTLVTLLVYGLLYNRSIDLYLEKIYISQQHAMDGLTKVMTKKSGKYAIEQLLTANKPGALFIFDLDNFKHFNDQYGHSYGDVVLQKASTALRSSFRKSDIIMRYGGDEFVVFMENGTYSSATTKVKQIQEALNKISLEQQHEITFSIGVALQSKDISFQDLFNQADQALYYVKKSTKHNYMFYTPVLSH